MKTSTIPSVRVSPELRQAAEEVLQTGETLSGFVEAAVRRNVEFRLAQKAFNHLEVPLQSQLTSSVT